jgi:hypothetical protein
MDPNPDEDPAIFVSNRQDANKTHLYIFCLLLFSSVADPGCLSRIPDPKTATKDRGEKKFFCQTIFCSHKFHKTEYYFIFDMLKKKI